MLENIPGVTLPIDGSVCLEGWLMLIIELTLGTLALILFTLVALSFRECYLIHRSRKEKKVEEYEHGLLAEKAGKTGVDEKVE